MSRFAAGILCLGLLTACSGQQKLPGQDSAPPARPDLANVADAIPRDDPIRRAGNTSPYTVLGKTYTVMPISEARNYSARGIASWYGKKFHGRKTANGEIYDAYGMTAAHKSLPIPSYLRVTNVANGRSVVVRVNDRGPFHGDRLIDFSYAAAYKLGFADAGTTLVDLQIVRAREDKPKTVVAQREQVVSPVYTAAEEKVETPAGTYLQAGAFTSLSTATSLKQTLAKMIAETVFIQPTTSEGQVWYRVRIGPVTRPGAIAELQQLIKTANLGVPHIVSETE